MIKRFQDICKEIYFEKTEYLYILQRYEIKKNKDRVKNRKSVLIRLVSIDIYILIIENICFDFLRTSYQEKIYKEMF
jgi:hypothetical protein